MAKVILRQGHGLEISSNRQEARGTDLEIPWYKANGLSTKTTRVPTKKYLKNMQ